MTKSEDHLAIVRAMRDELSQKYAGDPAGMLVEIERRYREAKKRFELSQTRASEAVAQPETNSIPNIVVQTSSPNPQPQ